MTRFQKLALATVATALLLVTIGVVVRATGSGLGCPDWPFCHGRLIPAPDDTKAWIEWVHRLVAMVLGLEVVALAAVAAWDHRRQGSIFWPSLVAVGLVVFQAYLGKVTVDELNSGETVTAHLATAMALVGLLVFLLARSFYPARVVGPGASQRFTLLAAFGAASVYALLLFGSNVTALNAALVFPDWPLMGGTLLPPLADQVTTAQVLHRWVAGFVGFVVLGIAVAAWWTQRHDRVALILATTAALLYPVQVVVGGLQILERMAPWTRTLHLALGALIWASLVGLVVVAYYGARTGVVLGSRGLGRQGGGAIRDVGPTSAAGLGTGQQVPPTAAPAMGWRETVRAYLALTKPRIIELLLITTVPAMILAARGLPAPLLIFWTLVGGGLAAGSANAINCYLDRDIDERMNRTRRRPLPSGQLEPEAALRFGLLLGGLACGLFVVFVNVLAAFLTLLAIAFYVVVYTAFLKRRTPQNIVIGGAAGALPPVIGWAAVTGRVDLPALLLFFLVFSWTPPHFWALAVRIRKDYEAAGVPMLPVVRGIGETARQILLYTAVVVATSLVFFVVGRMGAIYLAAAVGLGGVFLVRSAILWRQGAAPEASTAEAIRLYRYSITYLTLLFAAIALDALFPVPVL